MYKNLRFYLLILFFLATNAHAKTAKEIFAAVSKSVFTIHTFDANRQSIALGSGVVVAKGEIITNCHVVKDAVYYQVGQGKNTLKLRYFMPMLSATYACSLRQILKHQR